MFEPENAPKVLTPDQEEVIHEHAMRILEEIGTDVLHEPSRKLLADAGLSVDGERVRWDRGFVMDQVAKAPETFRLRARNPERSVTVGNGQPLLMNVGGPPFASDLDEGRRSGRMQDHDALVKMTHAADVLNCVQIGAVEATDLNVEYRHMDMEYWRSVGRTSRTRRTGPAAPALATGSGWPRSCTGDVRRSRPRPP